MARTRIVTVNVDGIGPVSVRQEAMESALGETGRWRYMAASRVTPGDPLTPEQIALVKAHAPG